MASLNIFTFQPSAVIRVTGEDAATFLQGQFTNDLRQKGRATSCVYGLWLNAKGKVLGDSHVLTAGVGDYLLVSQHTPVAALVARLEAFVIADDVVLKDVTADWSVITIFGEGVTSCRNLALPLSGEYKREGLGMLYGGRHMRRPNFDWLCHKDEVEEIMTRLKSFEDGSGWISATAEEMEYVRIHDGIARIPQDIGPADLPNEGGLDIEAIAYDKGCYTGQEVMARLHSMGQVRRRLMRVRGSVSPTSLPSPLYLSGKVVGDIRSIASNGEGFIGLAMLNRVTASPGVLFSSGDPAASPSVSIFGEAA